MIEVIGLGKQYADRWAVKDLSFTVDRGSVTGFLGLNGAGKSTTLRLMLGLENGTGRTLFAGVPYAQLSNPLRRVGALLDIETMNPTLSGRKQLGWYARAAGMPASRVDEVLELVGLTYEARQPPRQYSLGMKQRLGIATALLGDPEILILDEPGNGMDPQGLRWIADLLQQYADRGRTVFVSSHSLAEIQRIADHVVVINQGALISSGSTRKFLDDFAEPLVRVRSDDDAAMAGLLSGAGHEFRIGTDGVFTVTGTTARELAQRAVELGVLIVELASAQPSLEDAFFKAAGTARSQIPTTEMVAAR